MTIDREEMIAHFSAYGDVTGISMNPTRGYAFIDYRTNECVQIALRYSLLLHMLLCSTMMVLLSVYTPDYHVVVCTLPSPRWGIPVHPPLMLFHE